MVVSLESLRWMNLDCPFHVSCRYMEVIGMKSVGRDIWEECMKDDMKLVGLQPQWAIFSNFWRDLMLGKRLILA